MRAARIAALAFAVLLGGACGTRGTDGGTVGSDANGSDATSDADAASGADGSTDGAADATAGADTWGSWAEGFFTSYCNSCHSPGGSGVRMGMLDFTMYDLVVANAAEIRCGTAAALEPGCTGFPPPAQFPIACPCPSDPERDRLVAWIDAGSPF